MVRPSLNACIKSLTAYKDFTKAADVVATDSAIADELEQFHLAVSPERKEAFNKNVRQPFLDLLLQNLEDRFPQVGLLSAFSIFDPSEGVSSCTRASDIAAACLDKVRILAKHYGTGENPIVNIDELYEEWGTFSVMLADHYSKAKTKDVFRDLVLTDKLQPLFPQLSKLASVILTIPFSTADCERVFSTMKRVKILLRNRLKTTTLDWLLRISIEGQALDDFDFEAAIEKWASVRNRRLLQ